MHSVNSITTDSNTFRFVIVLQHLIAKFHISSSINLTQCKFNVH